MGESRIPEPDSKWAAMLAEIDKPVEMTPKHREFLDALYKFNGLDTTKKRIDYLNRELGFNCTIDIYGERVTPEQELRILEDTWVCRKP
jgi:hypothetical protein